MPVFGDDHLHMIRCALTILYGGVAPLRGELPSSRGNHRFREKLRRVKPLFAVGSYGRHSLSVLSPLLILKRRNLGVCQERGSLGMQLLEHLASLYTLVTALGKAIDSGASRPALTLSPWMGGS